METSKVSLKWITPEAEKIVMRCARVSSTNPTSDDPKLIEYCIREGHYSILEMANCCMEIETSKAISAQILRHRSFCFQEFSSRYQKVEGAVEYEARRQDIKNRQNSIDDLDTSTKEWFRDAQRVIGAQSYLLYNEALSKGIAKEQARFLLPVSSKTKLYMNGTLRSWVHYVNLRSGNGTQREHMEIATRCKEILSENLPSIAKSLKWV